MPGHNALRQSEQLFRSSYLGTQRQGNPFSLGILSHVSACSSHSLLLPQDGFPRGVLLYSIPMGMYFI